MPGEGCTGSNCDRRAAYLKTSTDLSVTDLAEMVTNWAPGGAAAATITADPQAALAAILTGMGSLSCGELAGQRVRPGLMLNEPEEEHDCLSDNSHASHFHDGSGIQTVYLGHDTRSDGSVVSCPSLADLVGAADPAVDARLTAELDATMSALSALKVAAEGGLAYDQMLVAGNQQRKALIMASVNALVTKTAPIERAMTALGLTAGGFEGSDSLVMPSAVFRERPANCISTAL